MRFVAASASILSIALLVPAQGFCGIDEKIPNAQSLLALQTRASVAGPREQCFLYAELVHQMTELANHQLSSGEIEQASATIHAVQDYAAKIHMDMADDSKRLKNAEILVRHTAFRLKDMLSEASLDDRPSLDATLKQMNQVQAELMLQVFRK